METKKLKIVAISDNTSDAEYFTKTIAKALPGTKVFIAADGSQGVKLAKIEEPDVILIDISISDSDCIKISRSIKRDKALQLTPLLFITDLEADRKLRDKALKNGAEAFLVKPFDDTILITQLIAMSKIKERNILIRTQKKYLEAELRRNEDILKTYIEKAPIGIFVIDASGKYVDVNAMACQLMGRTRDEVLSLSLADFLAPADLDKGIEGFRELSSKGFLDSEYRVRKKDSQDYWISLRGAKINDNCFIAFCTDISDRKEKEAKVEYLSYHDSLTGVYNRTFYEEEIRT